MIKILKAKEVVRRLELAGFFVQRITGSHYIMKNPTTGARTIVPFHGGKDISKSLISHIIKQAGLTPEDFFTE